jgi:hypothetical protein
VNYERFKELADDHKATKTTPFSQNSYINAQSFDRRVQNGVCRALSAAYIFRNFLGAVRKFQDGHDLDDFVVQTIDITFGTRKFFDAFHHDPYEQSEKDKGRWNVIRNVHARYRKEGQISKDDVVYAAQQTVAELSRKMLQFESEKSVCVYGRGLTGDVLPDQVGYWLISVGSHMMAVVIRNVCFEAKFFDPNYGHAKFAGIECVDQIRGFLNTYFKELNYDTVLFMRFRCDAGS